jgi:predicted Zn-dependent peptidase
MQNGSPRPYHRHVLPNGLRVLVVPLPHTRSVTVALYFGTGSRYEAAHEQGIAHLVEHMLFKGSRRYPSAQRISETIEGVGGILNAATDKELTVYYAKVASRHADLAFDLLSDMVQAPRFEPDELQKEKRVVLEELGLAQDAPGEWVHQMLSELLWPEQPLGWEIAGTPRTVNAQTRESLQAYVGRGYGPANTVLVVAGDADPAAVASAATSRFSAEGAPPPSWLPARPADGQPLLTTQQRETEQAYLCLGGPALSRADPDRYALRLANAILGDGMSSRLFLEVRERRGLAYDVQSYVSAFYDTGAVVVSAGVEPEQVDPALEAILGEVDKLRQGPVPEAELRKVKEYVKGRTLLGLEDSSSVASWYATQELLTPELLTPDEAIERIEAVSIEDILRISQRVFSPRWPNLSYIGPDGDGDSLRERLKLP